MVRNTWLDQVTGVEGHGSKDSAAGVSTAPTLRDWG